MGHPVSEAEVNNLLDPEAFRDAWRLHEYGVSWSPSELDAVDAFLLALIEKFRGAKRG